MSLQIENLHQPDYLFETSWEICNKVGGIYTVISTKVPTLVDKFRDNYILIGPDVWKETRKNPEFNEDPFLYRSWKEQALENGLSFKIGRWNIVGSPVVILVDFTTLFSRKDQIFTEFWNSYKLDSLTGAWDYVEPAIFGYAAGLIIESFNTYMLTGRDKIVAHFHEWMTGAGILYLKKNVPQVATVFTTHATIAGRSIAGNGLPLYDHIEQYKTKDLAQNFGITAKFSLEKNSAQHADAFSTVSSITAKECSALLEVNPDVITPNGFDQSYVPENTIFDEQKKQSRAKLIDVAKKVTRQKIDEDCFLIVNSGRYEYKNKGIDLFIKSLGQLIKNKELKKQLVAFILVPANHSDVKWEVLNSPNENKKTSGQYLTHYLYEENSDPIIKAFKENGLNNSEHDDIMVIFAPVYLDGNDGVFNCSYYDLLIGFDISVFPSYYEPWGYTPLESLAFKIPTITTNYAGFGMWVKENFTDIDNTVKVVSRDTDNEDDIIAELSQTIYKWHQFEAHEAEPIKEKAHQIVTKAQWGILVSHYYHLYHIALEKTFDRSDYFLTKLHPEQIIRKETYNEPQWRKVFIKSRIPSKLQKLKDMAQNLWWSWHPKAQALFSSIDSDLWKQSGYNPIALLESLRMDHYEKISNDEKFLRQMDDLYEFFKAYINAGKNSGECLTAYFCMEYGLHDSLRIFSGGLGILAGDFLKEASDQNQNLIAIGLLYRYGYFNQTITNNGSQESRKIPCKFSRMPIFPVRDDKGNWVKVSIALPGRIMSAKAWQVAVGRITLFLLDTDIEENTPADRQVTHELYGGNNENRLKQELLLGVGGIRLLDSLGISPDVYHCNEGHAAFSGLERLRKQIKQKFSFSEALEIVRTSGLFTTHTPVPAGHDSFPEDLIRTYLSHYPDRLNITWDDFMNLGRMKEHNASEKFSMSVLAVKLSRHINGVSKLHGQVSREMFKNLWKGYFSHEVPIGHVTNGVHFPTWTSVEISELFDKNLPDTFRKKAEDWEKIRQIPDETIWNIRKNHKQSLLYYLKAKIEKDMTEREENPQLIFKILDNLRQDVFSIGFARRFATYKRAHLLFKNPERLEKIINNPQYPVQLIFAGKAHPRDTEGQNLIKEIYQISKQEAFLGKIIFLENYDIQMAQILTQGVDLWLNTPTRPMEASGTSGMKAAMNGVLNLSVLDGWWAEGYKKECGWAIKEEKTYTRQNIQDELDSETIYNLLEDEIIPAFYQRNAKAYPEKWVDYIKNSFIHIAPHFTMTRMLKDYDQNYYQKIYEQSRKLQENNYELTKKIAIWKNRMVKTWDSIEIIKVDLPDTSNKPLGTGDVFSCRIELNLHGIQPEDIAIEVLFGQKDTQEIVHIEFTESLSLIKDENQIVTYGCSFKIKHSGVYDFAFRMYATNKKLCSHHDFNLLKWI